MFYDQENYDIYKNLSSSFGLMVESLGLLVLWFDHRQPKNKKIYQIEFF